MFTIILKDKKTKARLGVLKTPHGVIKTPSYVIVATHAEVKCLKPSDIKKTKTQIIIANTYHLWSEALNPKLETLNKTKIQNPKSKTFLLNKLGTKLPTMTDSGGFQVLSLAFDNKNRIGKFISDNAKADKSYRRSKIKITPKGVHFKWNNKWRFLGPALSMKIQEKIGADIVFAFDHITSPLDSYSYNKKALGLTHKWAEISLKCKVKSEKLNGKRQLLFGIVQGGLFKDLRVKSAKIIGAMPFGGFGIGGSYTKKQIAKVLRWIIPHLPEENPRHLLGVGKVEDVFEAVENGVDTFDCVIPTREARHGRIYTKRGTVQITRGIYAENKNILERGCGCPVCKKKMTRTKLNKLFKGTRPVQQARGKRYATIHNIWFFNNLLEDIRKSIKNNKFKQFKNRFLRRFKS